MNYYEILGLSYQASMSQIQDRYYVLLKQYSDQEDEKSQAWLKEIQKAYHVLIDPVSRVEYDKSLGIENFNHYQATPVYQTSNPTSFNNYQTPNNYQSIDNASSEAQLSSLHKSATTTVILAIIFAVIGIVLVLVAQYALSGQLYGYDPYTYYPYPYAPNQYSNYNPGFIACLSIGIIALFSYWLTLIIGSAVALAKINRLNDQIDGKDTWKILAIIALVLSIFFFNLIAWILMIVVSGLTNNPKRIVDRSVRLQY